MSFVFYTHSEPDRQNHFLTFLSFSVEGSGEEPNKKLKGNGFGRAVALVATSAMWRGGCRRSRLAGRERKHAP